MFTRLFMALGMVGLLSQAVAAGDISGQIVLTRKLTHQRVSIPGYQARGAVLAQPRENHSAVDEFSRMAVYIEGPGLAAGQPVTAELRQRGKEFSRDLLIIPAGSRVSFPNDDPIFHNVFSLSGARQFDLGYYPAGQTRMVIFNRPGVVQVYCHLHPDMSASILVVPNSWYTQPGKDGGFSIPRLPAGVYQLVVWHKSAGFFRRRIVAPESGIVELSLSIPVSDRGEVH